MYSHSQPEMKLRLPTDDERKNKLSQLMCCFGLGLHASNLLARNIYFDLLFRLRNSSLLIKYFFGIDVQICYFFYKNVTFGVTIFLYEAFASFSGKPAYNDWFLSLYNVFFTSLPVIALGVFDQDVSARLCIQVRRYLNSFGN